MVTKSRGLCNFHVFLKRRFQRVALGRPILPVVVPNLGYVGLMNGGTVSSESKTAKFMCSGVFDVEEAAACLASKDIVYRKGFIEELGFPQDNIPVYCDNAATVLFSASTKITSLNKHILIRGAYTRDLQKQGVITLIFCPGKLNLADQQTKNLHGETFYGFLPMYGFVLIPSYP